MAENRRQIIALCGNPNTGKSSVFNQLTGLNQKISNIPGTTIDWKEGASIIDGETYRIIDTPGTYSKDPKSVDEEAALEIFAPDNVNRPDQIIYVANGANLKRNLLFFSQLVELNIPMVLAISMVDVAEKKGIHIDAERLEKELGIPVILINARTGDQVEAIKKHVTGQRFSCHYRFVTDGDSTVETRYSHINALMAKTVEEKSTKAILTERFDQIATHPVWGYLIFLTVLLLVFQSVFKLAEWPMEMIELGFEQLGGFVQNTLADSWFKELLVNGIIAGLAGVFVFVPQIAILFFYMAILEDTGYMARVSFITDKWLRGFGLSGKSVIPLISGAACAIPAIMATRNIENWRDRMITILVTPLMSCSARLPVYTLLISLAVPYDRTVLGVVDMKALMLLGMYILGGAASLLAALVFKFIIRQKFTGYFIAELPVYHPPRWKNIGLTVWQKSRSFLTEAGKIILIVSIALWFLASYGPNPDGPGLAKLDQIEASYAGKFGKTMEPVIKPMGFNWKIGIALITSFAAREVFVGTMSTIYSIGDEENTSGIRKKMQAERDDSGQPVYSLAVVLSLMIFYAFAMQCMSTLAVVYKETKQLKWPIIQFCYMTGLAYLCSFITFQLLR